MSPFDLTVPDDEPRPLLVEIPHAGLAVPEAVADELDAPPGAILRDADIYVDKLYAHAPRLGATTLVSNVSRYVIDLNRARTDIDPQTVPGHPSASSPQPRGVIWRTATDGRPLLRRPLSFEALERRLVDYYDTYHAALRQTLERYRARFGYAILLAAHSMPSRGRSMHTDPGVARADIVPGTQGRTTADPRVIDLVDAHFREAGLTVRHDRPYRGGWTTQHYGRPASGWHAIQIELNRALYVDEATGRPRDGDFERLQELLDGVVGKLAQLELDS